MSRGVSTFRSRLLVPIAAAAVLLGGTPVPPASAGPPGEPATLAPASGTAAEPSAVVTAEAAAMATAVATGEPTVVDELTTEHQLVTADPVSGLMIAQINALPARVRDESGTGWVGVDPTLRQSSDGVLRPVATSARLEFSGGGEAVPLARMEQDGQWLALSWPYPLPAPVLDGAVATYPDAAGRGIDLVVQAGVAGFSHFLVVRDAQAAANPALDRVTLGLTTSGLTATAGAGGTTRLLDADGEIAFELPPARMWDSAGALLSPPGLASPGAGFARAVSAEQLVEPAESRSAAMPLEVSSSEVVIVPDQQLLHDPDTVFPVIIDPSYSGGHTFWRMVWSNGTSFPNGSTEQARVGFDGWSGQSKRSRVFYRFDISVMHNREIVSARFEHRQVHSPNHDCSLSVFGPAVEFTRSDPISSSTVWAGPTGFASTASTSRTVNGHSDVCGGWTRTTFSATTAVRQASAAGNTLTIRLRSTDESDRDGWRRFANTNGFPQVIATFNSPPSVPSNLNTTSPTTSCVTDSNARPWVNDNSPNLRATLSSPSGQNLSGRFERQRDTGSGFGSTTTTTTTFGSSGTVRTVGLTGLGDGRWRWRVRAEDTVTSSAFSSYCYFQLKTTPPLAPTLSISAPYSFDAWVAPDGLPQATLTVGRGSDTSVDRFQYSIGSATPTTTANMSSSTATVTFTPPFGVTTISARLLDRAGNLGPIATATLRVMSPRAQHAWTMNDESVSSLLTADLPRPTGREMPLRFGPEVSWDAGNRADLNNESWDRALRFPGAGAGAATDEAAVFELESFTVAAWVRLDSAEPGPGSFIAVSQDGNTNSAFRLGYAQASNAWEVWRNSSEGTPFRLVGPVPIDQVGPGGLPFPDGEPDWQHLAMVYDAAAGVVRLYVDGDLAGQLSYTFPAAAAGAFRVGRGKNGSGFEGARTGRVDDVVIFDQALGEAQIRLLRGADTPEEIDAARDAIAGPGPNTPPVAELDVECTGATCEFDAGAAHDPDGTLVNYLWDFGDGTVLDGPAVVTHTYTTGNRFDATLTVLDDRGATGSTTVEVGGAAALVVNGPTGRVVAADHPSLDITGEIEIRVDVHPDTWSPVERQVIVSKGATSGSQLSWALFNREGGGVSFLWSFNGTTDPLHFVGWQDAPVSGRKSLRITITSDGSGGAHVQLFVGNSITGPWTPQHAFHRIEPPTIFASTAPLVVGSNPGLWGYEFAGRVYEVRVHDGVGGPLVAHADFTAQWAGATSFVGAAGHTWQLTGSSTEIVFL